ncbi:MAG TPA: GAF domain-containing protein, partial [Anaerolineae bacterium]|nr:GAF domain-containing protein [Anaerolineae bacterium]
SSQAIQAAAEFQPDLILIRAGSEAKIEVELEVVRQIQKSLDIPVIYLLDQLDQEIVRQAEMTQPYHYLLRPFEARVLHLTIETALHQHKIEKKLKESEEKLTTVQAERQQSEAIERDQRLLAETLGRVGLALNAILDLPDLLDLICQESMNLFKVKAAYIWLVQGDELVGFAAHGVAREKFIGLRLPLFDPITLGPRVIREKRPIFVNEASQSSQINQKLRQRLQIKAILGVPLIKGDKAVGALMISDTDNAQRFGPDDIKTATALGSYAAIAIENARLLEAEREQRELAEALREVGTVLSATLDFNTILDYLLDQVARVVPYDTGNVFLIEHGYAHVVRTRGHEQFSAGLASAAATLSFNLATTPNMQQMVEIKQPLIIPDTATDPRWLKGEIWAHVRSWAGAPIVAHGQVSALFSLDKVETGFYQAKHAERLAIF